ncbi:MAG: undecaprenyl/decaprenyl-phosphate alpha-N-acetylglucosaminyl 1-phosphate transferase [Candidatus Omnitrophica bacterium]|nr:undecaprenyl/decaprenyl-phosphate alpha-N-acetylglucosaminyl 1-phosphate transferase [Candidatus Omnitrophota bacterium]
MKLFFVLFISFLVSYLLTPFLRFIAVRLKILDLPSKRKVHKRATPLLGGIAIYLGFFIGLLFDLKNLNQFLPILNGASIILVLGLIDDIKGLSASFRLLCQILVSLGLILCNLRITFLPAGLWGDIGEIILTVLWLVGLTNAFNYLDGLDGLACGSAIVNLLCFSLILYNTKQDYLVMVAMALGGACLGFLPFNFPRAKIFLGDAGSTFLGFSLAGLAILGNWAEDSIVKITIPLLILGVPIFDMAFTTVMRIKEAKVRNFLEWLQYSSKDHFHHYLVDLGMRQSGAVVFIYFVSLSLGISAFMVANDQAIEAVLTLTQAGIIFGIIASLMVIGKRRRSGWELR